MMTFAITQQTMLWAYGILHVAFEESLPGKWDYGSAEE